MVIGALGARLGVEAILLIPDQAHGRLRGLGICGTGWQSRKVQQVRDGQLKPSQCMFTRVRRNMEMYGNIWQ